VLIFKNDVVFYSKQCAVFEKRHTVFWHLPHSIRTFAAKGRYFQLHFAISTLQMQKEIVTLPAEKEPKL
jgi:hypothetical protein